MEIVAFPDVQVYMVHAKDRGGGPDCGIDKMSKISHIIKRVVIVFLLFGTWSVAGADPAFSQDFRFRFPKCPFQDLFQTPIYIEFTDGKAIGARSLHCLAIYLSLRFDKEIKGIAVGDYYTKEIIDAERAYWVISEDKKNPRTGREKSAFGREIEARLYVEQYGGHVVTFDEAIKASFEDMKDTVLRVLKSKREHKP